MRCPPYRMLLVAADKLVSRLPVYRTLVGLVAVASSAGSSPPFHLGAAVSDVYLSFARPLPPVASLASLASLVEELQCGAFVIGLPFAAGGADARERPLADAKPPLLRAALQQRVLSALLNEPSLAKGSLLACSFVPATLPTSESVAELHKEQLLWDQTEVDELGKHGDAHDAAIQAAVALQLFLDEHSGGWANTFG